MKSWNVTYDGKHIGQVNETSEANARCAAYSVFEPLDGEGHGTWDMEKLHVSEN